MPCLLSSKPQSFSPQFSSNDPENCNLFLLPLKRDQILLLHGSQVVQFDSNTLEVNEEILLESQIEAFKFDDFTNELVLKLSDSFNKSCSDKKDSLTYNTETLNITDNTGTLNITDNTGTLSITDNTTETVSSGTNESLDISDLTESSGTSVLNTITSKSCTWSLSTRLFSLTFSSPHLTCAPSTDDRGLHPQQSPVFEVIKDEHVACIANDQLQILSKVDRKLLSSVTINSTASAKSLVWIDKTIFIFSVSSGALQVLKYSFMNFAAPTNGCNWPLVTWSQETINVHRAGSICPTWYKLKNSEVWDVLKSPVGMVSNVQISADGSCLLVCGSNGVALCDFFMRNWQAVPFPVLLHPKWLGNSHVVALTPDNLQLILINRKTDVIMRIPIDSPETIRFIDTYNNWQLLIQKSETISIFAFDEKSTNFTFIKTVPFASKSNLKQAAHFKDTLFTLDQSGSFQSNNQAKSGYFESFLVLSTGHVLLTKSNGAVLINDEQEIELDFSPLAVLPFTNCLTVLTAENSSNFSLHSQFQSKFLLPELFLSSNDPNLLRLWSEDPLYPLALEYILLASLGKPEILNLLKTDFNENILPRAIVTLTRKIEVTEASEHLFSLWSPFKICQSLCLNDNLNFLPYLAKSNVSEERSEAILSILEDLFSRRSHYSRIGKVKEFLSAFSGLEDLFESALQTKICKLWKSGRLIKAFELSKYSSHNLIVFDDVDDEDAIKDYLILDAAMSSKTQSTEFRSWLMTHSLPKTAALFNTLFP